MSKKCLGSRHIEPLGGGKFSNSFHDMPLQNNTWLIFILAWIIQIRHKSLGFFRTLILIDSTWLTVDHFKQRIIPFYKAT